MTLFTAEQSLAACYSPQQQLPAQTVSDFLANPAQWLQQNSAGSPQMISRVRDLVASDPATLPAIQNLIASANANQKSAIGTGLGQAARICVGPDREFANTVQQAALTDAEVKTAYEAVAGDVATGAAGGGGAGGGGPGGGVATGSQLTGSSNSGGTSEPPGGGGVPTRTFTTAVGVTGGGSASITTTSTLSNSVSP